MNRRDSLQHIKDSSTTWDIVVIGGGATGLGIALDASLRGYKTLLLEQSDFAKGTSSRSTKLVHGGVRYLAQGNIKLVFEALHERGLLLKNAPHVCHNQTFLIPTFSWFEALKYTIGLKLYDWLSRGLSLGKSEIISVKEIQEALPGVKTEGISKGVLCHDGQFDDTRLAINLAQSAEESGAVMLNYMKVTSFKKNDVGKIIGVVAKDVLHEVEYTLSAKAVINATGVFVDQVLKMDQPERSPSIQASQGTHIVLDSEFLPSINALMIPKTSDGRVLFAIPWHDKIVVGTTDVLVEKTSLDPTPTEAEVNFILDTFNQYATQEAKIEDIKSVFCGLRPLVKPAKDGKKTKDISRSHKLFVEDSGLVTITGGKWTTYRKMAEETTDLVAKEANLPIKKCTTAEHKIHGYLKAPLHRNHLDIYGTDAVSIQKLIHENARWGEKIHREYPYVFAEVIWAVRNEMAMQLEDVLARRTRLLFLDVEAAVEVAPLVAKVMADELGESEPWVRKQISLFNTVALCFSV